MSRLFTVFVLWGMLLWANQSMGQTSTVIAEAVDSLLSFCKQTGANEVRLYHANGLVGSWSDTSCHKPMNTASLLKSWTGLVIGKLIDQGKIKGVDEKVCKYLPEWKAGCDSAVTLRHLLSMTAGLDKKRARQSVFTAEDMNAYVTSLPLNRPPGTGFSYSNESVQLLGLIIERATQKDPEVVFRELLWDPMEMRTSHLIRDSVGNPIVYGGALTTIDDAAKIGLMMHNKGIYKGKRIVSEAWVEASTQASGMVPYYGFLWWIDPQLNNYAATGDFGQLTIVFPEEKLVFVRQQSCQNEDISQNMRWMGPAFLRMIKATVTK